MKHETFDDFLMRYWYENEAEGQSKDQSEQAVENWLSNLDTQEVIDLGNAYGLDRAKHYAANKATSLYHL